MKPSRLMPRQAEPAEDHWPPEPYTTTVYYVDGKFEDFPCETDWQAGEYYLRIGAPLGDTVLIPRERIAKIVAKLESTSVLE